MRHLAGQGGVLTLLASFNNYHIFYLILLPFLYYLYIFSYEQSKITQFNKWERNCVALPSVLFAFFMIMGFSFKADNSWQLVLGNRISVLRATIMFTGYFFLFRAIIIIIFSVLDRNMGCIFPMTKEPNRYINWYIVKLSDAPFKTTFFTLFIIYIPYLIASYPGILMGDNPNQIFQGFNLDDSTSNYLNLISENMKNDKRPFVRVK